MMSEFEYRGLYLYAFPGEYIDWEGLREILARLEVPEVFRCAFEIPDVFQRVFDHEPALKARSRQR